jgi:protein TonB
MRDPVLRPFSGHDSEAESWLNRVRENLGQLLIPSHFKPSSANGAPIHLLKLEKSPRPARAQGASLLTHAAVFAIALFLLTQGPRRFADEAGKDTRKLSPLTVPPGLFPTLANAHPSGGIGSGGDQNPIPATHGSLPAFSSIVLVRPTLPQNDHVELPVPPTILDPNAAPVLQPIDKIGLPWMPSDTNSAGPGRDHGIGSKEGGHLGDSGDGPAGYGNQNSPFRAGVTQPACAYCPYPTYTDEARHGKVQGSVTLAVLVGADGRAQDVQIVKGIGFGLDERAIETVRGWKFIPARDGAKQPLAAWVTVEAVFRLF